MWPLRTGLAAALVVLACTAARGDEGNKPSDDPDPGFLEFLGSVDRLAEVNPDYLSQAGAPPVRQPGKPPATPPTPPPPRPVPPPPSASAYYGGPRE